jgi:hypothetical protein
MSTLDQSADSPIDALDPEHRITLDLALDEAEALRLWLLKPAADGSTALDVPLIDGTLTKLARAVDSIRSTLNVRHELEQAGLPVAHLTDDQVRELGRRVSEAAHPGVGR